MDKAPIQTIVKEDRKGNYVYYNKNMRTGKVTKRKDQKTDLTLLNSARARPDPEEKAKDDQAEFHVSKAICLALNDDNVDYDKLAGQIWAHLRLTE